MLPTSRGKYRLVVIAEPALGTRTILTHRRGGTIVVRGARGEPVWLCGGCAAKLAVGLTRGQLMDAVLVCASCGSYNDTSALAVILAASP
jgi:hypothetical protein